MDRTSSKIIDDDEEWDADGFEIPSLNSSKSGKSRSAKVAQNPTQQSAEKVQSTSEPIYLGPYGTPPKGQESTSATSKKQKLKQKLKAAEKKSTTFGRENKVEILRDLIGGRSAGSSARENPEGWLEPYCHENQFDKVKRPA